MENADVFDFLISQEDVDEMVVACVYTVNQLNYFLFFQSGWNEDLVTDWPGVDILSTPWAP